MRVSLSHSEIQAAVVAALELRGVVTQGFDISVSFSMGRKGTGLTGTVVLDDPTITVMPPVDETEVVVVAAEEEPTPDATPVAPVIVPAEDPPFVADTPAEQPTPEPEEEAPAAAPVQEQPKSLFAL